MNLSQGYQNQNGKEQKNVFLFHSDFENKYSLACVFCVFIPLTTLFLFSLYSAKLIAAQLKKRMLTNQPKVMFLSLGLLDYLMDKTNNSFHSQIAQKEFMQVLIAILNNKDIPVEVSKPLSGSFSFYCVIWL